MENSAWNKLGCPMYVVAPMVDASELAWRMLCRNYGAQLCYTPMIHAYLFANDPKYRKEALVTCKEDRPLVVQFCANDAETLLKAAELAEPYCDCIDINLGCPQIIAKRGHYGAFLQDEWDTLREMVQTLRTKIHIPISCKIRVFEDVAKTVDYAKMLESSGCQLLTVHGRTRDQKGPLTGIASWKHIKAIRDSVNIPIFANGNIQCLADVERCLEQTNCQGVMSAEGILNNPALFDGSLLTVWHVALQYLELAEIYPCPMSYVRGHIFKLVHHLLKIQENSDVREEIGKSKNINDFRQSIIKLKIRYERYQEGKSIWNNQENDGYNLRLPPWLCQPIVRISPEEYIEKMEKCKKEADEGNNKRIETNNEEITISKNMMKKLKRNGGLLVKKRKTIFTNCPNCPNPVSIKCSNKLCKVCCRNKLNEDESFCHAHRMKKKPIL